MLNGDCYNDKITLILVAIDFNREYQVIFVSINNISFAKSNIQRMNVLQTIFPQTILYIIHTTIRHYSLSFNVNIWNINPNYIIHYTWMLHFLNILTTLVTINRSYIKSDRFTKYVSIKWNNCDTNNDDMKKKPQKTCKTNSQFYVI